MMVVNKELVFTEIKSDAITKVMLHNLVIGLYSYDFIGDKYTVRLDGCSKKLFSLAGEYNEIGVKQFIVDLWLYYAGFVSDCKYPDLLVKNEFKI